MIMLVMMIMTHYMYALCISELLRKPLAECFCLLMDSMPTLSAHLSQASSVLEECVSHSLLVPEVIFITFTHSVVNQVL